MADEMETLPERKPRKSVAFSEGDTLVNENGEVEMRNGNGDKSTAESHAQDVRDVLSKFDKPLTILLHVEGSGDAAVDEVTDMFKGLTKKKKSKKPKDEDKEDGAAVAEGEFDPTALKKKKRKPKTAEVDDNFEAKLAEAGAAEKEDEEVNGDIAPVEEGDLEKGTGIWAHSSSQAIGYPLLLNRFFTLLHSHHPDLASSGTKSYRIPPPQCLREGNKKTIFANISEICKRMKRSDEHVTQFLLAELGTSGNVDGSRRLVIKGRFQQKQIENVLRRYIMEYLTCKTCRSPDTELNKGENRLYFITCNSCGSRRSVTTIKTGYTALVGKRKNKIKT
ncbi:MAG: hypothetical protein M1837_000064 [Sclerophora amabilis]|nr:MAG: hypothetical protein M1837_000064 [Sclerophora amabilis]